MANALDKWKLDDALIASELASGTIPNEIICLGCAAKVSLVDTVYPALDKVRENTRHLEHVRFQKRDDSYIFQSNGKFNLERVVLPLDKIAGSKSIPIANALKKAGAGGAILLFNFTLQPKVDFFVDVLTNFLQSMEDAETDVVVGKGHTIQLARVPEETLAMGDFIGHSTGNLWGLANNDTISTVDPMLQHTHKFAVAIAMNNTLNDLFIFGITNDFILYPSYDARTDDDNEIIRESLKWYAETFSEIGIEIRDLGPLNTNNKLVGATAIGFTDHEIPVNAGLIVGQKIIATRPIGDLAPLNEYLIRNALDENVEEIEHLRHKMIATMLIPNVEAARIIRDYLPDKGEEIDPKKHITATRDMSGPGMLALEELAEDSMCDIRIDEINFHDEMIPSIEVTNVTAGTNGAILIAASKGLDREIMARLDDAGYEPWYAGTVIQKSDKPTMILDSDLKKYEFLTLGNGFFRNYRFA
jgi:selenophosphate synthase